MKSSLSRILMAAVLVTISFDRCIAQEPSFVGRASCATATCHGGIAGQGPMWNQSLSRWEAEDRFHTSAGTVLRNSQSKKMVAGLLHIGQDDPAFQGLFDRTLHERCVSCHAPQAADTKFEDPQWQRALTDGVSCEACHGPASLWLNSHTQVVWDKTQPSAQAAGMLDTETWLKRTDNCLRCHVGSRQQDGLVRDMNHDMIAAGHPALQFDMSLFQLELPAHWSLEGTREFVETLDALESPLRNLTPRRFEVPTMAEHQAAQTRTLAAAAQLSVERMQDGHLDRQVPLPEFADYDCMACHRSLRHSIENVQRPSLGRPSWNPWYRSRVASAAQDPPLFLGMPGVPTRLVSLASTSQQQAEDIIARGLSSDPQSFRIQNDALRAADCYQVYAFYSELQVALMNARPAIDVDRFLELRLTLEAWKSSFKLGLAPHESVIKQADLEGPPDELGSRDCVESVEQLLELRRRLADEVKNL